MNRGIIGQLGGGVKGKEAEGVRGKAIGDKTKDWIPAFAGMTWVGILRSSLRMTDGKQGVSQLPAKQKGQQPVGQIQGAEKSQPTTGAAAF